MDLGGYRGVYNSAWIGCTVALVTTLFLSLLGFYLVKNAVERDLQTGVGQIIATTPLRKPLYTLGKALSNFAVLAVLVGIVAVASGVMQVVRGEDLHIAPWALLSPFLVLALPAMAVVAALAILFEVIPWLRGGLGNVIYFFLYNGLVVYAAVSSEAAPANAIVPFDVFALSIPVSRITAAVQAAVPSYNGGFSIGINPVETPLSTFYWAGIQWTPGIVLQRLAWLGVAAGIALGAALFFDRFDPARGRQKRKRGTVPPAVPAWGRPFDGVYPEWSRGAQGKLSSLPAVPEWGRLSSLPVASVAIAPAAPVRLTPLPTQHKRFHFGRMVLGELRLMLKGQRWWWYVCPRRGSQDWCLLWRPAAGPRCVCSWRGSGVHCWPGSLALPSSRHWRSRSACGAGAARHSRLCISSKPQNKPRIRLSADDKSSCLAVI